MQVPAAQGVKVFPNPALKVSQQAVSPDSMGLAISYSSQETIFGKHADSVWWESRLTQAGRNHWETDGHGAGKQLLYWQNMAHPARASTLKRTEATRFTREVRTTCAWDMSATLHSLSRGPDEQVYNRDDCLCAIFTTALISHQF